MSHSHTNSIESRELDKALDDTFPASDPPSMTTPIAATPSSQYVAQHAGGPLRIYRVVEADKAAQPFAPDRGGGRWTHPGTASVYAALSPAAALLEYLVHLEGRTPSGLLMAVAAIPAEAVLAEANEPSTWCARPYREEVRRVGDDWIRSRRSLGLRVPSAVCMDECNVLLNPEHPAFAALELMALRPLAIDERLRT
ncbi:MAG: RES domain-containing protein [Lysobacter sp.]|nr:RES domain-containing protein [Lysobacter sp.]